MPHSRPESGRAGCAQRQRLNAPLAQKGIKRTLNLLEAAAPLAGDARREAEALMAAAFQSEDIKEGQLAFMEKRPPHFVGR
jgi:enoyl-CoA hydratase